MTKNQWGKWVTVQPVSQESIPWSLNGKVAYVVIIQYIYFCRFFNFLKECARVSIYVKECAQHLNIFCQSVECFIHLTGNSNHSWWCQNYLHYAHTNLYPQLHPPCTSILPRLSASHHCRIFTDLPCFRRMDLFEVILSTKNCNFSCLKYFRNYGIKIIKLTEQIKYGMILDNACIYFTFIGLFQFLMVTYCNIACHGY